MAQYKGTSHIQMFSMGALLAMDMGQLVDMAKVVVNKSESAKTLQKDNKASVAALGKVIAALKRKFSELGLTSAMTFVEFWEMKTGTKKVNNHAESCGKTFGLYVETALITEGDYDANPADNLEKAAAIATKSGGDLSREEVLQAADILKVRHKDAAKQLQTILDKLNGPKKIDGETAKEQLALIFSSGLHAIVFAALGAEIHHEKDPVKLRNYMESTDLLVDAIPENTREAILASASPVRNVAPAKPAPQIPVTVPNSGPTGEVSVQPDFESWARTNLEGIADDEIAGAVTDLTEFHAQNGRLPASAEEFMSTLPAVNA